MIWQFGEIGYDISIDYNGRTGRKPVKWNYFGEWERRRLYNIWAELIALREAYPTFTTDNFSVSLSGASKQITLLDNDLDIVVVGNFDVFEKEITATFPSTGQWFEYYSQSDLSVETLSQVFTFAPGEFRLYSSSYIDRDDFILSSPTVESTSKDIDINVWPNPLSSNLKISILSDRAQPAEVNLYDINGRHLESVYKGTLLSGYNEIEWTKSHSIKTGIYMLVITTQSAREVKKVVVQ
jgi:hypothetical protein